MLTSSYVQRNRLKLPRLKPFIVVVRFMSGGCQLIVLPKNIGYSNSSCKFTSIETEYGNKKKGFVKHCFYYRCRYPFNYGSMVVLQLAD